MGKEIMEFFSTSKVFPLTLLVGTVTINVQPTTSSFTTIKNFADLTTPVNQIILGSKALNIVSDISEWVPQSLGSGTDDEESRCLPEATACVVDSACFDCATTLEFDCDATYPTCSGMVDTMCCMYGESCRNNTALVALVDCTVEIDGCHVDDDLCDTEDDNGAWDAPVDTECPDELTACWDDADCLACFDWSEDDDDACSNNGFGCDDQVDAICCFFGGASSGCGENGPLLDYVNCIVGDMGCHVDEDLCDTEDDNGARVVTSDEECPDELTACWEDADCLACFEEMEDDEDACYGYFSDCNSLAAYACCSFGGTSGCAQNDFLLEYVNCYGEELISTECSITDMCDFNGSGFINAAGWSSKAGLFVATATGLLFAFVDMLL